MLGKLTADFIGKKVASEFYSYTTVKITFELRINMYFNDIFHLGLDASILKS